VKSAPVLGADVVEQAVVLRHADRGMALADVDDLDAEGLVERDRICERQAQDALPHDRAQRVGRDRECLRDLARE
jgi:hypothetical protein